VRVQRGTVLSIRVAPRAQIRFSELHIDESQYKETDGGHVPNYAYYTNDKEGVQVEVKTGFGDEYLVLPRSKR